MGKVKSRVEAQFEAASDRVFGKWLCEQARVAGRVVARDGVPEVVEFGAVNLLPWSVRVPEWEFEENPGLPVARLVQRWREEIAPTVVVEVEPGRGVVLRLGRHVPVSRAHAGSVLLG